MEPRTHLGDAIDQAFGFDRRLNNCLLHSDCPYVASAVWQPLIVVIRVCRYPGRPRAFRYAYNRRHRDGTNRASWRSQD